MRRYALVVLVVSLATLGSSLAAATGQPRALDATELTELLLAPEDMPSGWAVNSTAATPTADETSGFCDGPNELARAEKAGATASAHVSLASESGDSSIDEAAYSFPNAKQAKVFVKATKEGAAACRTWQVTGPDGTETLSAAPTPFPDLADQTFALRNKSVTADGSAPTTADQITIRDGSHAITLFTYGAASTVRQTKALAKRAAEKLDDALQGT